MPFPIRQLPVLQNWDCQGCTNCCREYHVHLSDEERQRIESQGWQETDLAGTKLIVRQGRWRPQYALNHRPDGSCVFLSEQGRCRIHEKFGSEAKPFACRLFPFILVPVGDHWRVSLRYSCPSVAKNEGRPVPEHETELRNYAAELKKGEHVGELPPPSPLQGRQAVAWNDLLTFNQALLSILKNRQDRVERRWRKCLALAALCRQAKFDQVKGARLLEFLKVVGESLEVEVPAEAAAVRPPTWAGRILFRQLAALYARKDIGPDRGLAAKGRLALLKAAWQFARGTGPVPRVHGLLPDTSFEQLEMPAGPLSEAAEAALERYYLVKVGALQFCGPTNFGLAFWEGLDSLALTLPVIFWLSRAFADLPRESAIVRAIGIVDNNFGFTPSLGTRRQRFSLRILAGFGELEKLIAWYSR